MSNLFEKAYVRLTELYGGENHSPDVRILSRFYREKAILKENELYLRYLEFFGRIREVANKQWEHIAVRGTAGSSLIAYLLGATDINPLPRFEYCPHCRTTKFCGNGTPYDRAPAKCPCGEEIVVDGHSIPFEANLKFVMKNQIQLGVSYAFFEEAKRMIYDEMWDKAIVTLKNEIISPTWFCFLDREENDDGDYLLDGNAELFGNLPRITLVPLKSLDKYRELERATGFKMKNIGYREISFVYPFFTGGNFESIPNFDTEFMHHIAETMNPTSYDDFLRLIGFAHSTKVWSDNAEILFDNHKMSLREIPAYREGVYEMICDKLYKNSIYDTGLAYEVMEKVRQGYYARHGGMDEDTTIALLNLGFDMDYLFLLEEINYMFPKAHGVAYLKEAITMMYYKLKYPKEFYAVMTAQSKTEE